MDNNISPEEILRRKEIAGGIEYDDPKPADMLAEKVSQVQELATKPEPVQQPVQQQFPPQNQQIQPVQQIRNEQPLSSLGKAQSVNKPISFEMGWKKHSNRNFTLSRNVLSRGY